MYPLKTAAVMGTGADLLLPSLMVAALALLFQECMKSPMLFVRYRLWLLYLWRSNWRRRDRWKRKAYMLQPLGLCVYCNSAWIAAVYYLREFGPKLEILLFLGLVFLWVKIFLKLGLK